MRQITFLLYACVGCFLFSCQHSDKQKSDSKTNLTENREDLKINYREKAQNISYHFEKPQEWLAEYAKDSLKTNIVLAVNRTDKANLKKMNRILIPNDFKNKLEHYLPFPLQVEAIKKIPKIIFFSYPTQTFAAYENGSLVYTGPTNMGRQNDPTPTGLIFTNWKAEETTSTFNDEWELKWNFNIENKKGIGFHEYILPGYPASHSCLRLCEKDARFLYDWAEEWVLKDDQNVQAKGTPVVVFGKYDFQAEKPWLQLVDNPKVLEIAESQITSLMQPYMAEILKEQNNAEQVRLQL